MPSRLFTVAVVVAIVATLVGIFVDIPILLADEGININGQLIITGIAAFGTVGTLTWAVINGLDLRRRADVDRREADRVRDEANIEKKLDQARRISAWSVPLDGDLPAEVKYSEHVNDPRQVNLTNSSSEAVYNVVAYLVWMQGAAPGTAEEIEKYSEGHRMRAIVQVLPPGNYKLTLTGPSNHPMQGHGHLGLEIAFTDGAGRHWIRRAAPGALKSLDTDPITYFGINRPLPPYNKIEPW
ncbi:hypothetical protein A5658_02970 [Mycobacterium sp. 1245111.1]|uniref:hypothetical protein n=1 Tax=Mycobacterium sp. 1245111.1 TaxID=1834073 RepID=UPI0007FD6F71|nr:hypothetical protein [Mycobacterium sp. 1245111.1]OBK39823.1 hypothetical protein A5658_02970 [Mycobacterium sp. 1245111.1]